MTEVMDLPLDSVHADPQNVRTAVDADRDAFTRLCDSVRAHGVLQPITVRQNAEGYVVVFGHRRLAAAREVELPTIRAILTDASDAEAAEQQVVENLQRVDLTPMEEARGYFRLSEMGGNMREVAKRVGRSRRHVQDRLALLSCSDHLQGLVDRSEISPVLALRVQAAVGLEASDDMVDYALDRAREGADLVIALAERAERDQVRQKIAEAIEAAQERGWDYAIVRSLDRADWPETAKGWRTLEDVGIEPERWSVHEGLPQHAVLISEFDAEVTPATTKPGDSRRHFDVKQTLTEDERDERARQRAERAEAERRRDHLTGYLSTTVQKAATSLPAALYVAQHSLASQPRLVRLASRLLALGPDQVGDLTSSWEERPESTAVALWSAHWETVGVLDADPAYREFLTKTGWKFE